MATPQSAASNRENQQPLVVALAATARGDDRGLTDLYRLTSAKLYGVCLRICGSHQAAEDTLSEVYLSVWRRADMFDANRASPITWLCAIARNRSIDWVRSNGRTMVSDDVLEKLPSAEPDAETQVSDDEERQRLRLCLDKLRDEHRDAIRTAFFDGLSYSELAERKKVPLGTMKSWVRRGLISLKDCLDGE